MRQKKYKDTDGMSFSDNELPPDPKVKESETLDQAEIDGTAGRILQYVKERSMDKHLVYRKELEMITQNTDEIIDAAVEKLKHDKEISEINDNEFRVWDVSKSSTKREVKEMGKNDGIYDITESDMPTQMFDGERIDMDEILDKTIIIRNVETRPSSFGEGDYAILQVEIDEELHVVLTGSKVLVKQIKDKTDRMPFRCKIIEQKSTQSKYKYYTLAPVDK